MVAGIQENLQPFENRETIEKAAQIYMLIAHHDTQQRVTDQELADLAKAFNVTPKDGILNTVWRALPFL